MGNVPNHDLEPGHIRVCQICGSEGLIDVIDFGHLAPCDSLIWPEKLNESETVYPLHVVRCPECSLVQIDYVVEPEELFFSEYPYRSGITQTLVNNLRSTGPTIMNRYGIKPGGLAIDIGSNDGTLLSGFKDAGMEVLGVEPTNIAKIANDNGIETIQEFFSVNLADKIVEKYGQVPVVTAANMFAHVSKLGSLIEGVERLLQPNGIFVTESHYLVDLIETIQYDSIYHEHLKYYSAKSIIKLFNYYGFTVVDIDRIPNYGGSIRVYAMKGIDQEVKDSVKDILRDEEKMGLYDSEIYDDFVIKIKKSKYELQRLILDLIAKGQKVVGIGCPGRAATLLGYCNIDPDLMPYIAEQSTSLKLGLFVPGVHLPIVDEKRLFEEQPEYAVMLSWHYWEPILKKMRSKGLKAKIIIPLPEVKVIEA